MASSSPHHHPNEVLLQHLSGSAVLLMGTHHVAASHGTVTADSIIKQRPERIVLELDSTRFQQIDYRLRHLLHQETASLLEMTAAEGAATSLLQQLLPDALLWTQHMQQFALMRNEGVPLLLGSLYGADFLQAALAASALPQQAAIVLADQPQHLTMARFRALTDTYAALRRLLGAVFGNIAHAEAFAHPTTAMQHASQQHDSSLDALSSSSSSSATQVGVTEALQQLRQVLAAAAQLAAGRMVHLCLQWWSMALSSQARWYGEQVHPVFLLVGDADLQQRLAARGCLGVAEAAAAAGRLLEVAAAAAGSGHSSSSSGGNGVLSGAMPAVEDVLAIRQFVTSLESIMWRPAVTAAAQGAVSAACSPLTCSSSSRNSGHMVHWLQQETAGDLSAAADGNQGFSELLPLRPWWVTLSESFTHKLAQLGSLGAAPSSGADADAGSGLQSALQGHQHANVTAAAAYDQAVMAERNRVLVTALWQHAEAAAAAKADAALAAAAPSSSSKRTGEKQQQHPHAAVVAVVGYNHVPGIVQLWRQLQQQQQQQDAGDQQQAFGTTPDSFNSSSSSSRGNMRGSKVAAAAPMDEQQDMFLPWQVTVTDAVAGVLELAAAGGAGLAYWAAGNRWILHAAGSPAAAGATAGSSGSSSVARLARLTQGTGLWRLGLLLLPAAVALLPLQRDAKRAQEAGGLLSKVAVVNDVILRQEAEQLARGAGADGAAGNSIMQLAQRVGA